MDDTPTTKTKMSFMVAFANVGLSVIAYFIAYSLIGSDSLKKKFIKANLFGKDLNKKSDDPV